MEIKTIENLKSLNKEIYYLLDNRKVDSKCSNVKGKMKSIKENGLLSPLHLIPAENAFKEGLSILDETGTVINEEQAKNGYIIADGNNRYIAIRELRKTTEPGKADEEIKCWIDESMTDILKNVIEMNNQTVGWRVQDYAKTAEKRNPENKFINYYNQLVSKKYSPSTISLYMCFNKKINKSVMATIVQSNKLPSYCTDKNADTAEQIIETLTEKGFSERFLKKRYLIENLIELCNSNSSISKDNMIKYFLDAVKSLTETQITFLEDNVDFNYLNEIIKQKLNNN